MDHSQCIQLQPIFKIFFWLGNVGVPVISAYVLSLDPVTDQYPWTELIYKSQLGDSNWHQKSLTFVVCITGATVENQRQVRDGTYRRIAVPQITMHKTGLNVIATSLKWT